jgi:hypothetical protein
MRKLPLVLLLACAAGVLLYVPAGSSKGPAPGGIRFETPSIADPIHTFGEPTIGVDPQGRVFVSGPTGTGTQRSEWEGSVDGGHSYRVITPGLPPSAIQSTQDPPGGGDTDLNFDRAGHQYFADLYALACLRVARTDDGGATVSDGLDGCGTNPSADRQWLAVYDPAPGTPHDSAYTGPTPLVYLEYNNDVSGGQWNKSTDGTTYSNAENRPASATYSTFGPDGYPAIDQQSGKVFQASGSQNLDGTYDLLLNVGTPDASGNLTFVDAPSGDESKLIHIADNLPGSPDMLFSVASIDSARNLFVAWGIDSGNASQRQIFVSGASAASGWKTWTKPVQVSDGSTATGDAANIFPWIKAGGPGRADTVWYGSDKSADPSSQSGQNWNVFMAQTVFPVNSSGALTGAAPSVSLVQVSPHPMHYGGVCLQGTGCIESQGNRNLADFFSVTVDKTGAAEIVYDDTSNGLSQPGFTPTGNQTLDHAGAPLVTVVRQSAGPGLFGKPVSGPADTPRAGITDPSGDALYPVIGGTNVPGLDIVGSSLSLGHGTLTITTKVVDLSNPTLTAAAVAGTTSLQYVTRWQMGNTLYYGATQLSPAGTSTFSAGATQSVDLCSVSACFPHVLTYPEASLGGTAETGTITCPAAPSASSPCTIVEKVNTADVGNPGAGSQLEEVGSYSFTTSHPQGATTNPQAQADNVPLQIDGACCYRFAAGAH